MNSDDIQALRWWVISRTDQRLRFVLTIFGAIYICIYVCMYVVTYYNQLMRPVCVSLQLCHVLNDLAARDSSEFSVNEGSAMCVVQRTCSNILLLVVMYYNLFIITVFLCLLPSVL